MGDDFYSVELIADDATADGVSVQTDETVVESPPVADHDVFFTIARAEDFFGKIKGIMRSLFVSQTGIRIQVFQCDRVFGGQGMVTAQENMGPGNEQTMEFQIIFPQRLFQDSFVEVIQVENPDFTAQTGHVLYDFIRRRFADAEIILIPVIVLQQFDERFGCKGIVLAGNAELMLYRTMVKVLFFNEISLLYDLTRIREKFLAFGSHGDALAGTVEYFDTQFCFQVLDSAGQAGLGNE